MGDERASKPPDLLAKLDEVGERLLGIVQPALHRPRVELLERELDLLEGVEVALEHPVEQVGEKLQAVQAPRLAASPRALAEALDDRDLALVHGDDPALGDEAVDAFEVVRHPAPADGA